MASKHPKRTSRAVGVERVKRIKPIAGADNTAKCNLFGQERMKVHPLLIWANISTSNIGQRLILSLLKAAFHKKKNNNNNNNEKKQTRNKPIKNKPPKQTNEQNTKQRTAKQNRPGERVILQKQLKAPNRKAKNRMRIFVHPYTLMSILFVSFSHPYYA